jgi:hypothetical protein
MIQGAWIGSPFVVSLSNHERAFDNMILSAAHSFDKLRMNGFPLS